MQDFRTSNIGFTFWKTPENKPGSILARRREHPVPRLLQCSMFNRARGLSLLAQARQSRVRTACKCLVIPSIYQPHPGFAWSVATAAKNYNIVRSDNAHMSTSALISKRHASTTASGTILNADSVDAQMQVCLQTKDFHTALDVIEQAQALGVVKPEHYEQLFAIETAAKADLLSLARIAHWFTSTQGQLPANTKEEIDVWKSVMKACFKLARSHLHSDLDTLLKTFIKVVNTDNLRDADVWGIVLRGHGILKQEKVIDELVLKIPDNVDYLEAASLAYSSAEAWEKSDIHLQQLLKHHTPDAAFFSTLARTAAFCGDVDRVKKIANEYATHMSFDRDLLLAYKTKLMQYWQHQGSRSRYSGRNNKSRRNQGIDGMKVESEELISIMLSDGYPLDTTTTNIILDYLTLGNRMGSADFPMSRARDVVEKIMPAKGVTPNFQSYFLLLRGYAKTREFDTTEKSRLDMCLEVFYQMEHAGFNSHPHAKFQCLFEACLPHSQWYNFDNFRTKGLLAPTIQSSIVHNKTPIVDPRIFDIEKIMLESNVHHDRITIKTLLTCFGVSGQFSAMWRRWKELEYAGVRRDTGLYERVFALAALDPEQAQYALSVVRHQLTDEVPKDKMTLGLYQTIIDCCIAAQDATSALAMLHSAGAVDLPSVDAVESNKEKKLWDLQLRAQLGIRSLTGPIDTHLKEAMALGVRPTSDIWLMLMSHAIDSEFDLQNAQRVFNGFTMSRFEQTGKVPLPAHTKSPVIPFPSAPYSETDVLMIDMFLATLLKSQNIPVIRDVLETYVEQSPSLWLSRDSVKGFVNLAKKEKSRDDVKWLVDNVLPKVENQSSKFKRWASKLQSVVNKA
ncbi:hypothetical protein NQZ79_g1660 [Umbelopsis isabellina]|nr:hypothetical protein NQZ79_g1660 [Umbelopsis isabellina]